LEAPSAHLCENADPLGTCVKRSQRFYLAYPVLGSRAVRPIVEKPNGGKDVERPHAQRLGLGLGLGLVIERATARRLLNNRRTRNGRVKNACEQGCSESRKLGRALPRSHEKCRGAFKKSHEKCRQALPRSHEKYRRALPRSHEKSDGHYQGVKRLCSFPAQ
jgi:hypothetical protein